MSTYFTSDTHFSHGSILRYSARPWTTVEEMDEGLIASWNYYVRKNDLVYFLGDFAFCGKPKQREILKRLNGTKHLIKGNHDASAPGDMFETVSGLKDIRINEDGVKTKATLCHYAMRVWNCSHYGAWNLHGHSHGTMRPLGRQLDIGVDNAAKLLGEYRPFSVHEIAHIIGEAVVSEADYHKTRVLT